MDNDDYHQLFDEVFDAVVEEVEREAEDLGCLNNKTLFVLIAWDFINVRVMPNFIQTYYNKRLVSTPEKCNPRTFTVTEHERGNRWDYNVSEEELEKKWEGIVAQPQLVLAFVAEAAEDAVVC